MKKGTLPLESSSVGTIFKTGTELKYQQIWLNGVTSRVEYDGIDDLAS